MRTVAPIVAERIMAELRRPIFWQGKPYEVTVSIGITYSPRHARAADVLRDADTALYRAKNKGRNRIEIFNAALGADVSERGRVEAELRSALNPTAVEAAALTLAYQPVYDLADNHLVGFEALARLHDRYGRTIAPDVFIPIAEETGLITTLGERVLDEALASLARWQHSHPDDPPATMAVNLSARQAQRADMPDLVRAALHKHHLDPTDLILELTESVLLESGASTLRQIAELHELGVNITIDDFGTGYASLRYLVDLPVSSVKVDRSFTATMIYDRTSATIVRTVANLAADLDLRCIIEGVETQEQLNALPNGVQAQGYLMGRPTAAPENTWPPEPCANS